MQTEGIEKQRQGLDELADERFNEYAKPLSDLLIQVRKRLMTGYVITGSMFGPLAFWFFRCWAV